MIKKPNRMKVSTRYRQPRFVWAIPLALLFTAHAIAQGSDEPLKVSEPEWCQCALLNTTDNEDERALLLDQIRLGQSVCWQEMGVSPTHARKGQGAGLDACACACLNEGAEPAEGPWGDKKKPGKQGQGNQMPAADEQPDSSTTATDKADRE